MLLGSSPTTTQGYARLFMLSFQAIFPSFLAIVFGHTPRPCFFSPPQHCHISSQMFVSMLFEYWTSFATLSGTM